MATDLSSSPAPQPTATAHRGLTRLLQFALGCSLVLSAASAYDTLRGSEGLPKRHMLERDLNRVQQESDALTQKLAALHREIIAQKDRPIVQEGLVRDVLGYVRPDEIVLQPR